MEKGCNIKKREYSKDFTVAGAYRKAIKMADCI